MVLESEQKESCSIFRPQAFDQSLDALIEKKLERFRAITRKYVLFHLLFATIALCQLMTLLVGLSFFNPTTLIAIVLAAFFLSAFSYFVLLFYLQAKKPEDLLALKEEFSKDCQTLVPFPPSSAEYHLALSHGLGKFVQAIDQVEYQCFSLPFRFKTIDVVIQKFSAWCHWRDVHKMQECLLLSSIDEHVQLIKEKPTDLEAHAALGKAYIALSRIYTDPRHRGVESELPWVSSAFGQPHMRHKFVWACKRAIEEFHIIDTYTPNDPWIHAELAKIYHDLEMPEQEIEEYEKIKTITPDDSSVLLRLGILYFQEGQNAKGLEIYEELKHAKNARAKDLIAYYDAFSLPDRVYAFE